MEMQAVVLSSSGVTELIESGFARWVSKFVSVGAMAMTLGDKPFSMVIGRPNASETSKEDGGRTLVLPLPPTYPKLYLMRDNQGTLQALLASEYISRLNRKGV